LIFSEFVFSLFHQGGAYHFARRYFLQRKKRKN